ARSRHPFELATAMASLLRNERARSSLGASAVKTVAQKFTIKHSIDQYRGLYAELLGRPVAKEVPPA
ncbi:MAG: hypothetical protein ACREAO_05215, partial [Nitrososphaera sp.]